ncbi:phosphoenolpyruvate mutase [Roseomonas sp. E05]|uniref:phosphoenolpyruvate mutase n=1 Tax=Roseomonas sp. E05 TaxID=3046310 RepID=UPI0024BA278C|nr:phosphoenolpyruvate mutase [Roseomonas sp. E05]MDJ0391105.1 phosphoenolpyruvate mutase [Roseomonas sp. E05]
MSSAGPLAARDGASIPARDTRFAALRREIMSPSLSFLMEAHDGMSAKIVQEAGFRGVWASGLTTSAALGLRDSNEASWTQVLDVLEYMADATSLPILVDGDTGHGNFNNVRRFVRKLGERGIAGVCIEDKLFPKTNSFLGEAQPLADVDEFCGRIKAGKDSQTDDDFVLVARVEALISGHSMEEALRRAEAYHAAGADAILIHSKKSTAEEIFAFTERWGSRAPVVIVPTMYYSTPTELFRQAGISTIIWANHLMRSSIAAMRETAQRIHEDESLVRVEGSVATVKDIFRITGNAELEEAERRYLPARPAAGAVVLAAAGGALGGQAPDQPKCMVDIRGQSLLKRLAGTLRESGVRDITVVRGDRKEAVALQGARLLDNDRHAETGEAWSLACAREAIRGETVVVYGDVLFRRYILDSLLTSSADVVIAVDTLAATHPTPGPRDLVAADHRFSGDYLDDQPAHLRRMGADLAPGEVCGEWMGLARFSARGAAWLREEIAALEAEGLLERADMPLLLTRLAARHPVRVKYFTGHWLDVDTLTDLAEARNFT